MLALVLLGLVASAAPDALVSSRALVVPGGANSSARVEEVYAALRAAGLTPVGAAERAGVDRPVGDSIALGDRERAKEKLQEARARYRRLEFEDVLPALQAVWDELLRLSRPEDQREMMVDALLFEAAVRQADSPDSPEARRALRLAARLEPERPALHPGLHPPSVVDAFARACADNDSAAEALIVVQPRVVGDAVAQVIVDGVGAATSGGLVRTSEGPHLITLRAEGVGFRSFIVDASTNGPNVIEAVLEPPGAPARRAALVAALAAAHGPSSELEPVLLDLARLAAAGVILVDANERSLLFVVGRGIVSLNVKPPATPAQLSTAVAAALLPGDPLRRPADDGTVVTVGVLMGAGALVLMGGASALLWALVPMGPTPAPPPRPVVGYCCVQ